MANPIRIHTHLGEQASVLTLYFNGKWVTMAHLNGKSEGSTDATNLEEGGRNHLHMAHKLREKLG